MIFRLLNKNQINLSHFRKTDKGVYLNKLGIKVFIEEFEKTLESTVTLSTNKKISYRSLLKREVHKLEKSIKENTKYNGYLMRW